MVGLATGLTWAKVLYPMSTLTGLQRWEFRMSVLSGYLTTHQAMVWDLFRKGLSQARIASKLGVSRQAVHKTIDKANERVMRALLDTAQINKLDIKKVDPAKGVLAGYSRGFQSRVFLTYSAESGVQLWYEHQGQCEGCNRRQECIRKLCDLAKEWEITLTEEDTKLAPTLLAEKVFKGVADEK
jgi:predicted transcriptional regulator